MYFMSQKYSYLYKRLYDCIERWRESDKQSGKKKEIVIMV